MMFKKIKRILYRGFEGKDITYKTAKKIIKKEKECYLIDVRSKQEYEEEHLNEAINICLYNLERSIEKEIKNKQAIIILYCASGIRSKKGKEILENMGYKNVYSLKHGISGINWKIKQVAYLFFLNKICISKKYLVDNIK